MYGFEVLTFNGHGGYVEAIVRGYRSGLLTSSDDNNLCQCESLEDVKMHLSSATDYGAYTQNEPSNLHTTTIVEKCTLKLVDEYKQMLCQIQSHDGQCYSDCYWNLTWRNATLSACLTVSQNMRELYRLVLVDTPLAPYFSECITSEDLDDMYIEIMMNTLCEAYVEDFYSFGKKLGGATAEIISDLLAFEADRRAVNITINSSPEMTEGNCTLVFGFLYPYGHKELAVCEDIDQVNPKLRKWKFMLLCHSIFAEPSYGENQMLDRAFYDEEVIRLCSALEQQFHYAVSFAYMRLKEQEIRNLMRISESEAQNQKSRGHDSTVFTF